MLQRVMESAAMVAPPLHLHLRFKGILPPLPPSPPLLDTPKELHAAGSQSGGQRSMLENGASQLQQGEADASVHATAKPQRMSVSLKLLLTFHARK